MKAVLLRDNLRALKVIKPRPNPTKSQSPPNRHLVATIKSKHTSPHKFDLSLQDTLLTTEVEAEDVDFRVEIEKRFMRSQMNREFKFPLKKTQDTDSDQESDSADDSMEELRHVTVYDLSSQNKPKKSRVYERVPKRKPDFEEEIIPRIIDDQSKVCSTVFDASKDVKTEQPEVRRKIKNQEREQKSHKKLINIINEQWNTLEDTSKRTKSPYRPNQLHRKLASSLALKGPSVQNKSMTQVPTPNNKFYEKLMATYATLLSTKSTAANGEKSKSQERHERKRSAKMSQELPSRSSVKNTKNFSREFTSTIDTTSFALEKSFKNLMTTSTKTLATEASVSRRENLRKVYSNSVLRAPTPRSTRNMSKVKESQVRVSVERDASKEKAELHPLYKKAQDEILNEKFRTAKKTKEPSSLVIADLLNSVNKEEEMRTHVKKSTISFYGTLSGMTTLFSTPKTKTSGQNSVKNTQVDSLTELKEKPSHISCDFDKEMFLKKIPFKLDFGKRTPDSKDFPSTIRSRSKFSVEKGTNRTTNNSTQRKSNENSQRNTIEGASTYKRRGHGSLARGLKAFTLIKPPTQFN